MTQLKTNKGDNSFLMQGAALLTQYAADNIEVEGNGLQSSFYLAFGATGALLRHERLRLHCCLPLLL